MGIDNSIAITFTNKTGENKEFKLNIKAFKGLNWIKEINSFVLPADIAIYIDVPPEVVVKRIKRKKSVMERLETQRKVQEVYMMFVKSGKLIRIDGDRPKVEVEQNILSLILEFLEKTKTS